MAERSVSVFLRLDAGQFVTGTRQAKAAVQDFSRTAAKSAKDNKESWDKVGKGMLMTGGAIAVGLLYAVKAYADFDAQLSNVRAVSGATAGQMRQLSDAALKAGADTKFSAMQAAQAQAELAKVGISVSDILGGALTGALDLAAAGNLDLARAAEISGQAMKIFNLRGKDVGRIADVLASGANKSAADVEQLAQALAQGGLVAAQTGLSLDDTVGTLSAFADNALLGSDAGTSFKTMLQRLNPQSQQAADLMDQLGLRAYDSSGQFVGITAYAGKLQTALSKMSTEQRNAALQTLFGSDAVRAATVLYSLGEEGVQGYVTAVNDQGAAARVAAINMDNLKGDVEQLRGSIETALIQSGSAGNDVLRDMVQVVTGAVNAFGELPQPLQQGALGFAAVSSAALLTGGAVLNFAPKVKPALDALSTLGITASRVGGLLTGPLGFALATGALAVGAFAKSQIDAKAKADSLRASLDQQTGAVTDQTRALVAQRLQSDGVFERYAYLAGGVENLTNAALGNADALAQLHAAQQANDTEMAALVSRNGELTQAEYDRLVQLTELNGAYGGLFNAIGETTKVLDPQIEATKQIGEATGNAASGADQFAGATQGVRDAAKDAGKAVDDLVQSLAQAGLVQLSTRDAARNYQQSLADATAAVKENGRTLNIHTQEGRDNQKVLDGVANSALNQAQAIYESTKATKGEGPAQDAFRASLLRSRDGLAATAERFGMSRAAAKRFADQILQIPPKREVQVGVKGAAAGISEAQRLRDALLGIRSRTVTVDVITRTANKLVANPKILGMADGGLVTGVGGPRQDNQPRDLSVGEFVVNAAATAKNLATLHAINGSRPLAARGMADGGIVTANAGGRAATSVVPSVEVYVQSPVDGSWVRAQARTVVKAELRSSARALVSGRR